MRLKLWNPAATGPGWALSPALEPLAPVKDYLNVVSGMDPKIPNSQGHHTGEVGILSGTRCCRSPRAGAAFRSTFTAPSIDQVVAAETGKLTRFKSLELGISRRVNTREGTTLQYISHNGPDSANPPSYEPAMVFNRLFGADFKPPDGRRRRPATAGALEKAARLRRSVLDAVAPDIEGLKLRVGAGDRRRLDQHFETRAGHRAPPAGDGRRSGGAGAAGCAAPGRPAPSPTRPRASRSSR